MQSWDGLAHLQRWRSQRRLESQAPPTHTCMHTPCACTLALLLLPCACLPACLRCAAGGGVQGGPRTAPSHLAGARGRGGAACSNGLPVGPGAERQAHSGGRQLQGACALHATAGQGHRHLGCMTPPAWRRQPRDPRPRGLRLCRCRCMGPVRLLAYYLHAAPGPMRCRRMAPDEGRWAPPQQQRPPSQGVDPGCPTANRSSTLRRRC